MTIKILFYHILLVITVLCGNSINYSNYIFNDKHVFKEKIENISCGYWNSFAVDENGKVMAFGANWYGQLGDGTTEPKLNISKINGLKNIIKVASGSNHCIALKDDGTVWVWGANDAGQLGINMEIDKCLKPVNITSLSNISDVACGDSHTTALSKNGTVWAWGSNGNGQLGDGTFVSTANPFQIKTLTNIVKIACEADHSMALKKDGTVWAWGSNGNGQLGNGTFISSADPFQIKTLTDIAGIACGADHSMALKKDGTVWAWGSNGNGQLGDGTTNMRSTPIQIRELKDIVAIACGDSHSIALSKDGMVWAWGGDAYGQLGVGNTTAYKNPVKVDKLRNIKEISANYNHNLAIDNTGKLWAWGNNWQGQLGTGSKKDQTLPVEIIFKEKCFTQTQSAKNIRKKCNNTDIVFFNSLKSERNILSQPLNSLYNNILSCSNAVYDYPSDKRFNEQWALNNTGQTVRGKKSQCGIDINIIPAWKITKGSEKVIVGILDTGVDIRHIDLKDNIYINSKEIPKNGIDDDGNGYIDDINGWDFANCDNTVYDTRYDDYHGTLVAGIIAACANNIGIRGVAPKVKILPLKFVSKNSRNVCDLLKAIEYADKMGVKIINCSFGANKYNPILEDIIRSTDILFIVAAGNDGKDISLYPVYPAYYDLTNIISVTAIDNNGQLLLNSNYGNNVDIAAPGKSILSTFPDDGFSYCSDTSFAAPYVSGVAALIKSYYPSDSCLDIASRIINNASYSKNLEGKVFSKGIVNAYASLRQH